MLLLLLLLCRLHHPLAAPSKRCEGRTSTAHSPLDGEDRDGPARNPTTTKALLAAKASPHAPCGNGKTPIEIATSNGKKAIVELLQAATSES